MQIKIENTEITLDTFTIKYSDDFNILSFTYQCPDEIITSKLEKSFEKKLFKIKVLNKIYEGSMNSIKEEYLTNKPSLKKFTCKIKFNS